MSKSGFFKIHRCLFEHPIWQTSTPEQKVILITLIEMVNHKPGKWEWKGQQFEVDRGQTITSLPSICAECGKGVTIQNVRTALKRFEKYGFLTDESTERGRLITIVNYSKWQDDAPQANRHDNRQLTDNQQTPNRPLTANKNDKNDKNDKKDKKHTYGEMNNVRLTDEELEKLKKKFPYDYNKRIDDLSIYISSKGDKYKSHYSTILSWSRKNNDAPKIVQTYKEPEREIPEDEKITDEEFEQMMGNISNLFQ